MGLLEISVVVRVLDLSRRRSGLKRSEVPRRGSGRPESGAPTLGKAWTEVEGPGAGAGRQPLALPPPPRPRAESPLCRRGPRIASPVEPALLAVGPWVAPPPPSRRGAVGAAALGAGRIGVAREAHIFAGPPPPASGVLTTTSPKVFLGRRRGGEPRGASSRPWTRRGPLPLSEPLGRRRLGGRVNQNPFSSPGAETSSPP